MRCLLAVVALAGCDEPKPPAAAPPPAEELANDYAADAVAEQAALRVEHAYESVFAGVYTIARPRNRTDRRVEVRVEAGERPCAVYWRRVTDDRRWEHKPGCSIAGEVLAWPALGPDGPPALIRRDGDRFRLCRVGGNFEQVEGESEATASNAEWADQAVRCVPLRRGPLAPPGAEGAAVAPAHEEPHAWAAPVAELAVQRPHSDGPLL